VADQDQEVSLSSLANAARANASSSSGVATDDGVSASRTSYRCGGISSRKRLGERGLADDRA